MHEDIVPLSGASAQWLLTSVTYNYESGFITISRADAQEGSRVEFYPVEVALLEILERELALHGIALPR